MRMLEVGIHLCCRELDCFDIDERRRGRVERKADDLFENLENSGLAVMLGEGMVHGVTAKVASRLARSIKHPSVAQQAAQGHDRVCHTHVRGASQPEHSQEHAHAMAMSALMYPGGESQHRAWADEHRSALSAARASRRGRE